MAHVLYAAMLSPSGAQKHSQWEMLPIGRDNGVPIPESAIEFTVNSICEQTFHLTKGGEGISAGESESEHDQHDHVTQTSLMCS